MNKRTATFVAVCLCFVIALPAYASDVSDSFSGNVNEEQSESAVMSGGWRQWATWATASSEYSSTSWSAMQATGPPNTGGCGDFETAWAPRSDGTELEWLEVRYDEHVPANGAVVYETYSSGFIYRIDSIDEAGEYRTVWTGTDPTPCPGQFSVMWPTTPYNVIGLRIHTEVWGWEEIDAVALIGHQDETDVMEIEPSQGFVDEDTEVTLTGEGFDLEASVLLTGGGPFLAGSCDTPGRAWDVAVAGDYAYVVESGDLQVIDVSDPQAPALAGSYDAHVSAHGVAVAGDYAYVADGFGGLQVIRPNPLLLNVSCLPDTTIHLTVPPGFNPGPYDVRVTNPDGEGHTFHNGFRACERRSLTSTLQSLDGPGSPRPGTGATSTTWRLTLDGDDVFFPPQPRHQAVLLLPELPSTLETRFEPGDGSGGMVIRLELFPVPDSGIVRLIGDDPAALEQSWDEVRSLGGAELPRRDLHSYGDLSLTVMPANVAPMSGQAATGIHYAYELTDGQLTAARVFGPDADLVIEILAWDKYRCETVETMSVLEAMGGPRN